MRRAYGWLHMHGPIGARLSNSGYMPIFAKKIRGWREVVEVAALSLGQVVLRHPAGRYPIAASHGAQLDDLSPLVRAVLHVDLLPATFSPIPSVPTPAHFCRPWICRVRRNWPSPLPTPVPLKR